MKCPAPERLFTSLAGGEGTVAQASAEVHAQTCRLCRASVEALVAPEDSLVRLIAQTVPASAGRCPEPEDLACWSAADRLPAEVAKNISLHVAGCEACAFSSSQLRLDLGKGARLSHGSVAQHAPYTDTPAVSTTPQAAIVAQVVGVIALVLAATSVILPRLNRPGSVPEAPKAPSRVQPPVNPIDWPVQAFLEFRLKGGSETHRLMFPHHPPVHLSKDYEYAVHFTAQRAGWLLLFSMGPDQHLSLLTPGDVLSDRIPHLDVGQTTRFPSGSEWEPITASSGSREFYAVYLDSAAAAEEIVAESRKTDSPGRRTENLAKKLDEMVVADGCSSVGQPCVLTLGYEVF